MAKRNGVSENNRNGESEMKINNGVSIMKASIMKRQ
jgi:hypothetical protein